MRLSSDEREIRLTGNLSSVWRRGDTVRRFHDATAGFHLAGAVWRSGAGAPGGGEVICHNDVAHYNTVFRAGRPVAFIDWDFAAPGPRAWDLAYAACRFVDVLLERIEAVCRLIVDQAAQGDPAFRRFLAEGHVAGYRRDLRFIESIRADLGRALARPPGGPPGPGPGRRTP